MLIYLEREENVKTYKGQAQVMELSKKLGRILLDIEGFTDPQSGHHYDYTAEYNEDGSYAEAYKALLRRHGWLTEDTTPVPPIC